MCFIRFMFFWLGMGGAFLLGAERGTADFYQSTPQAYLGKEVRLRAVSVTPSPDLTALDKGFVWMEALTGRPKKPEGTILLRVPESESGKLVRAVNLPSSPGHWITGVFWGHESGEILPETIAKRAPYYIQMDSNHSIKGPEITTSNSPMSGSLVVPPKVAQPNKPQPVVPGQREERNPSSSPADSDGPVAVLFSGKKNGALQLRMAQLVHSREDCYEIMGFDGKISLLGKALVLGILPLPKEGVQPTIEEIKAVLQTYDDKLKTIPQAAPLLAEAKAQWSKLAPSAVPAKTTPTLPAMEEVETAAGDEIFDEGLDYPFWFLGSAIIGAFLLGFLIWIWARPRSTSF